MIDTKNVVLIGGVLVLMTIVGLYIPYLQTRNIDTGVPSVATTTGPLTKVAYTNSGFEPATITVKVGTTVEWTNTSDKLMWIASNPHPSHTDLPGFDERGVEGNDVPTDQPQTFVPVAYAHTGVTIFRYTFLRVGHWGYHNHLVPQDRGVVTVLP